MNQTPSRASVSHPVRTAGVLALALLAGACSPGADTGRDAAPAGESPGPARQHLEAGTQGRPVVYQLLVRLFGNTTQPQRPWGTREENGVGRFEDINDAALAGIAELGTSHVWYTGVLHHAVIGDFSDWGIDPDDPDVVKGRAGSPYAIRDYYSVNPDLARDPSRRMEEFRSLVERTHAHGMGVVIDIVPNHVARHYRSLGAPEGVPDFGADDDTSVAWARDNSFYYIPGECFEVPDFPPGREPLGGEAHPMADGRFHECPARWTGNDVRTARPSVEDWYETVKLNYGVRPDGGRDFDALPDRLRGAGWEAHHEYWDGREVPATWRKMRHITEFWMDQGVDGFRFDMAEMVPVEFWSWLNSALMAKNPDVFLLAEIYNPEVYEEFVELGLMGWLYDKVDLYDQLKLVMQDRAPASSLLPVRDRLQGIEPHLLRFLENHDEQRIASPQFAGDARLGRPAMLVTTALGPTATLLYFGQEVGEPAVGDAGFGQASRSTIFDYWHVPHHQRWMNGGAFDGGQLAPEERALREFHVALMQAVGSAPAMVGGFTGLHRHNLDAGEGYDERLFAWARSGGGQHLLAVAGFDAREREVVLSVPRDLLGRWGVEDGMHPLRDRIGGGDYVLVVSEGEGRVDLALEPFAAVLLERVR